MSSAEITLLGAIYDSLAVILAFGLGHFVVFEAKTHGKSLLTNKFVMISIMGNAACLLNLIFIIVELYQFTGQMSMQKGLIDFSSTVCILISLCAHISMVYLRSKAVFTGYSKSFQLIKFCSILFLGCAVGTAVTSLTIVFAANDVNSSLFQIFTVSTGVFLGIVDMISTWSFANYVKEVYSTLGDTLLMKQQQHVKQSHIIARRGVVICCLSALSLFCYIFDVISTRVLVEMYPLSVDFSFVTFQILLTTVMILWMWLKIELDRIDHMRKKASSVDNEGILMKDFSHRSPSQEITTKKNLKEKGNCGFS
jgi:hypothetical protein